MQKESLNTKTGDNYRLPKNIIMIIAIVALGTAAAFTIAGTRNTGSIQFNAMQGPQSQKQMRSGVIEDEEIDEEESDKESEKDEESTDSEKMSHPNHADRLPGGLEPQPQGQAPAPGSNDQTTQIILFSVEAIAASLLIIYLIMSGFNKKSFKETLSNSDKALIFILSSILLAAAFVVTDVLIANAINGKPNEVPQGPQIQMQGQQQDHPQMRAPRGFEKPKLNKS